MNELDEILWVRYAGMAAAIVAFLLYVLTSIDEPSGFRLVPSSTQEWRRYWFRTLMFVLILSAQCCTMRFIHPGFLIAFVVSWVLLAASSAAFWRFDCGICIGGFVLCGVAVPWVLSSALHS